MEIMFAALLATNISCVCTFALSQSAIIQRAWNPNAVRRISEVWHHVTTVLISKTHCFAGENKHCSSCEFVLK